MTVNKQRYYYLTKWHTVHDKSIMNFYLELTEKLNKNFPNEPPTAILEETKYFKVKSRCVAIRRDYYDKCCEEVLENKETQNKRGIK